MKEKLKNQKGSRGITLIALVITIIVLLILAAVSIATLTGENGILTKATKSKVESTHSSVEETIALAYGEHMIEQQEPGNTTETFMEFLERKEYIKQDTEGVVDTNKLLGETAELGNGTGNVDVYKVEEEEGYYKLNYYNEKGEKIQIGIIGDLPPADTTAPEANVTDASDKSIGEYNGIQVNLTSTVSGDYPITVEYYLTTEADGAGEVTGPYHTEILEEGDVDSICNYAQYASEVFSGKYYKVIVKDASGNATILTSNLMFYNSGCFEAGTQVATETGMKNIEDINVGEKVYAVNMDTNEKELQTVLKVFNTGYTTELYNVYVGEEKIGASPEHKFYVEDKGWIQACELEEGDKLVSKNSGENMTISKIEHVILEEPLKVYNLTVDTHSNFLITEYELLVHNISK